MVKPLGAPRAKPVVRTTGSSDDCRIVNQCNQCISVLIIALCGVLRCAMVACVRRIDCSALAVGISVSLSSSKSGSGSGSETGSAWSLGLGLGSCSSATLSSSEYGSGSDWVLVSSCFGVRVVTVGAEASAREASASGSVDMARLGNGWDNCCTAVQQLSQRC